MGHGSKRDFHHAPTCPSWRGTLIRMPVVPNGLAPSEMSGGRGCWGLSILSRTVRFPFPTGRATTSPLGKQWPMGREIPTTAVRLTRHRRLLFPGLTANSQGDSCTSHRRDSARAPQDQTRPDQPLCSFVPFYNPSMQPSSRPPDPSCLAVLCGMPLAMSIVLHAGALLGPTPHDAAPDWRSPKPLPLQKAICTLHTHTLNGHHPPSYRRRPATACAVPPRYCRVAQSTALIPRAARMPARMLIGQLGGLLGCSYSTGDSHP